MKQDWQLAEDLVCSHFQAQGWEILGRNYRHIGTEIDLIAQKQDTLVFVEVKYRKSHIIWEKLLTPQKKQALSRGAKRFLTENQLTPRTVRFDLVIVDAKKRCQYFASIALA